MNRLAAPLCLGLLLLSGCGKKEPAPLPPLEDLNVLLIVIDTLGAGHVGHLAGGLDTTPNIDRLAAEGVAFTRAQAPSPWTQPSIASLLTGRTPSHHGVLHLFDRLAKRNETLAEMIGELGHATSGVVTHILLEPKLGFAQGFDRFDHSAIAGHDGICSPRATAIALDELRRLRHQRFFLMVHLFDPHSEYLHHPDFDRTSGYQGPARDWDMEITRLRARRHAMTDADLAYLRDLYREEIAFTDHYVGLLLDKLDDLGLADRTLVILTADHGEEFMEHDWIGHTRFLYDTLLHVPLVFRLPGVLEPARRDDPVSLLDVAPTVMDLATEPPAVDWDGRSLIPLLRGGEGTDRRPLFSEVAFVSPPDGEGDRDAEKDAFLAAVSVGDWKLIHDLVRGEWELYDRAADPGEHEDRYAPDNPVAGELRPLLLEWEEGKVDAWGGGIEGPSPMTDAERERLRSLGYVR